MRTARRTVNSLFALYKRHGLASYGIGENVTQSEHAIQAAMFAKTYVQERRNKLPSFITSSLPCAALFHDVGHMVVFVDGYNTKYTTMVDSSSNSEVSLGVANHEEVGSRYLASLGFCPTVCRLVLHHVSAKRYLVAKDVAYFKRLSEASVKTLQLQGGPMTQQEMEQFEQDPLFPYYLKMRDFDDQAKQEGMRLPKIESFRRECLDCIQVKK